MLIIVATLMFGMAVFADCSNIPNSNLLGYLKKYGKTEERTGNRAFIGSRDAMEELQRAAPANQTTYYGFLESLPEDDPLPPTNTTGAPDICKDPKIDAATRMSNGDTYVFKGNFYWRVLSNGIAEGWPRRIWEDLVGLEGNLDAAITSLSGQTFFFKGNRYWRFTNMEMDLFYPRYIRFGFEGIPDNINAALVWGGNRKPYFFKGSQYWRYDSKDNPPVKDFYPLQISEWNGLPNDIDAALRWENGVSYFFKGDKYWKYNDKNSSVDGSSYPRSTAKEWFGC